MPNVPRMEPLVQGTPLADSPTVGQHTAEILEELDYDFDAITALSEMKVTN